MYIYRKIVEFMKSGEMKVEMVEIGVQLRRLTIISSRKFYRLICNHPFLVGFVLFLFFIYRSFPFLFSILVSTSPVVFCTFLLLGFLLSLGDPKIPEIEKEEAINHEIVSLVTEVQRDTTIVERELEESFLVERYTDIKNRDELENLLEEPISRDGGLVNTPLIENYFTEIKNDEKTVFLENQYSRIEEMDEESDGLLYSKSPIGSIGSVVAEPGDSPPGSPWQQFGGREDERENREDSDSGSDGDESSSPDASMADIIPLLDELHPLLNLENPIITHSDHGSDHSSHRSRGYKKIPNESGEESETHDDDEEREETGHESKPEITWTEDDQKNLMDLGTLEIERNQRLESLIARRRARKLMVEKNLIDLNYDIPINVAPISTTRRNPFDFPYNSNENTNLPPIPGSAPSIMSRRRNPFDLPYDSSEEKPDLTEDSFQQEFSPLPKKENIFRRHESFNIGPSIFAPPKFDRDDFRLRPYFVPEGSSDSSFRRQMSEISDISKVSSVVETESISSDENIIENILGDVEMGSDANIVEDDNILGDVEMGSEVNIVEDNDILGDVEMGSDLEDPSELVGHGSESSEDEEEREVEERETEHDEVGISSVSLVRTLSTIEEVHYSSGSSSLSEEHENDNKYEVLNNLELEMDKIKEQVDVIKEPVYDLSPSSVKKNQSCSSISSDLLVDQTSEIDKTVVSFSDRQIDFCTENIETENNESGTSGVTVKDEQNLDHGLLENDEKIERLEDQNQSNEHEDDHKISVQNDVVEEYSFNENVIFEKNEEQIHSSSSNAYSTWVSVEKPMDELHFFNKSVAELSAKDHEEILEPSIVRLESITEDHDGDKTLSEDHNLDQTLDFQSDTTSSHFQEPDFIEKGNEIQEIDEGLLMELDNVGDFSIGNLGSNLNNIPRDIDSILLRTEPVPMKNEAEISSRMMVLDAEEVKSDVDSPLIEEIEAISSQISAENENKTVFEPINSDEMDSGMHELEVASIQDINTAFRHIIDHENSVVVDSVDAESSLEKIEAEVTEVDAETENKIIIKPINYDEIDSGMHELDATSIQDIDTAFKHISDHENSIIVDSVDAESSQEKIEAKVTEVDVETENKIIIEPINYDEIDSGIHELEATSIQDINIQIIDDEKLVTVDSLDTESLPENIEAEVAEIGEEIENKNVFSPILHEGNDAVMHELEVTSIQYIDTAFKQIIDRENSVIVDSLDAESSSEKIEAEVAQIGQEIENENASEPILYEGNDSVMHEREVTSIQDIDTAFRQIIDHENPVIVDSRDAESSPEKIEAEMAEVGVETENKNIYEPINDDEIDSGMHELDATSIQDIDTAFKHISGHGNSIIVDSVSIVDAESSQEKIEAEVAEISEETDNKSVFESTNYDEIDSGMHELEATSIQDINAAFREINDKENENPMIVDSIESLPEKVEAEVAKISEGTENITNFEQSLDEIDSATPKLEAISIQDINTAFRQIKEEENEKPVVGSLNSESSLEKLESEVAEIGEETENKTVFEPILYEEIDSSMHELQATSIEDINAVFGQINEGEIENPVINEKMDIELLPEKVEAEVAEISEGTEISTNSEQNIYDEIDSEMHELEATSIQDIDTAFRQIKAEEIEKPGVESLEAGLLPEKNEAEVAKISDETENKIVFKPINYDKIGFEMDEFEATSLEDINTALTLIKEEESENYVIESLEAESLPENIEAKLSEIGEETENKIVSEPIIYKELGSGMHELEAASVEDISIAFMQINEREIKKPIIIETSSENIKAEVAEISEETENKIVSEPIIYDEIASEIHELEATSIEDINTVFRQTNEGEIGKSSMVKSLEAESLLEKIEADVSETEAAKLPTIEARSTEDIDPDLKQHNVLERYSSSFSEFFESHILEAQDNTEFFEANVDDASSQNNELENSAVLEPIQEEEINSGMEQLEAQSFEDIYLAFRQMEKESENTIIVESIEAEAVAEKIEAGVFERETPELPVLKARSSEGIDNSKILEKDKSDIIEADEEVEEISSRLTEFDLKSDKDIDTTVSQIKEVENPVVLGQIDDKAIEISGIVESLETDLVLEKSELEKLELSVSEAKSIQDIDLAFQQIHDIEKHSNILSASYKTNILEAEDQAEEINSEMLELDPPSIKNINTTSSSIKGIENVAVFEPIPSETIDFETKDLEARSLENSDLTFRNKELLEKPVFMASHIADLASEESEAGVSQIETREMPIVEASSIEDIGLAFKQVHKSEENRSHIPENSNSDIMETEDQEKKYNSKMVELDAQSIEDIDVAFNLIKEVEKPAASEPVHAETVDLEMKDFEARSPEDINLTFRHIENKEVEKPISIASLIADLAPDESQPVVSEIETPELPVVEARSIKDIGLEEAHESVKSNSSDSENEKYVLVEAEHQTQETAGIIEEINTNSSFDQINKVQNTSTFEPIDLGMKELEAESLGDIQSAFKQFKEEIIEKPIVIESRNAELVPEKNEAEISETGSNQNEPSLEETTKMELPVVEARSTEHVSSDKPSLQTEETSEKYSNLQVENENKPKEFDRKDKKSKSNSGSGSSSSSSSSDSD